MQDQTLMLWLVGLIAVALLVQAGVSVVALLAARKLEQRFERVERELQEWRPSLERVNAVLDDVSGIVQHASLRVPQLVDEAERTVHEVRDAARFGVQVLLTPLKPLGTALALWKGLKTGASLYRRLGAPSSSLTD